MCCRSICQLLAHHQRHQTRERKGHESETGEWRPLVFEGPVWMFQVRPAIAIPQKDEQTDVGRGCRNLPALVNVIPCHHVFASYTSCHVQGSSSVAVIMSAGCMLFKLEAMCWCILLVAAVILSDFYNLCSRDVRFNYYCSATGLVGCCYSNVFFTVSPDTLINDSDSLTLMKCRTFNMLIS